MEIECCIHSEANSLVSMQMFGVNIHPVPHKTHTSVAANVNSNTNANGWCKRSFNLNVYLFYRISSLASDPNGPFILSEIPEQSFNIYKFINGVINKYFY